jgi:asparagine synthase (glutamine-hydrolysing)
MCGIVGIVDFSTASKSLEETIYLLLSTIEHRGPDGQGAWFDQRAGIALGHRRLSIIDLTATGKQPMVSPSGNLVITYNGEIYNFSSLKNELIPLGHRFVGTSDTEVILHAIEQWGLENALKKFSGMFAFCLWDQKNQVIHLARDRMGEKPLYFGKIGNTFIFASELKPIQKLLGNYLKINDYSTSLFFRFGYIPIPFSIYHGIFKLPPGMHLSLPININKLKNSFVTWEDFIPFLKSYWDRLDSSPQEKLIFSNDAEAIKSLEEILTQVVGEQMVADVPYGAFLSGGIDSSTIVAVMQKISSRPINTFSIGFNDPRFNEASVAKAIAAQLGTNHVEQYLTPQDCINILPELTHIYDEPFADSSQIPTIFVSRLARKTVKVALSGDGGDEVFGGYNRYLIGKIFFDKLKLPGLDLKKILFPFVYLLSHASAQKFMCSLLPPSWKLEEFDNSLQKLKRILSCDNAFMAYTKLVSRSDHLKFMNPSNPQEEKYLFFNPDFFHGSAADGMMLQDMNFYLPNDILTKVDRASMSVGLEARAPFLDRRMVEFALKLPSFYKLRGLKRKYLLRSLLYQYLPKNLFDRPKKGFSIPLSSWLRSELKDWAYDTLNFDAIKQDSIFNHSEVIKLWDDHQNSKRNNEHILWDLIIFNSWINANKV